MDEQRPQIGVEALRIPNRIPLYQHDGRRGCGSQGKEHDCGQGSARLRGERLLTWGLLARAYLWLGMLEATAAMAAFFFVLNGGGWHYGETLAPTAPLYLEATTACLAAIVVMQVVNVFLCRDERRSAFAFGLASNPLLLWGIAIELLLLFAIVYTPLGQALFGTAPLSAAAWLFMLPFAAVMVALEEGRKAVARACWPHA